MRFNLPSAEGGKRELARIRAEEDLFARIIEMPKDSALQVTIEPYKAKLKPNLRARLKILTRELAEFCGLCYEEMNGTLHNLYYPKRDIQIDGRTVEVSIPTNDLKPDEARILEQEYYNLGARIGCPLSIPQAKD